jgi:two-component system, chemotaxis family, sensor kinase Cph1
VLTNPPFGQADLTNCERELIHLAGSVQPHGLLLALREPELRIAMASANVRELLGVDVESLLNQPLAELGGDVKASVQRACAQGTDLSEPAPLRCRLNALGQVREFEGAMHRVAHGAAGSLLLLEIEPADAAGQARVETVAIADDSLHTLVEAAVQRFSAASAIGTLADGVVRSFRDMLGYDRVMVYKFDPDGHGKIIAEARDPRLESLLGHHYPASDIPQRARELYLRNRLRVLVDVHYEPSPLLPRRWSEPGNRVAGDELDMSMCYLRSMSPLHLQYLKNMGVTATLVVSLVREGRLWGLIACHHYAARNLRFAVQAAAGLLAEVASTRIAAIENYAHAQVAIQVRRLEQRLVEATSTEGDWRLALFRNPRTVLQPLEATGAALFHDGELLTAGEAPSTAELRALLQWIETQPFEGLFSCSSVVRANPALDPLTPTASGVLAVKLSATQPDYLMWFRKEQLLTVTWAGDPSKPMVANNPLELSPRSSFAAWSEIVRGTALPWSPSELALGRAFGAALIDIIVQVNAVRLLIAEHQLAQIRTTVGSANEAVVIADASGRTLFANDAFAALRRSPASTAGSTLPKALPSLFSAPEAIAAIVASVGQERRAWRGELALLRDAGTTLPVAVRIEVVPARDGTVLGFFLIFTDLTDNQRAEQARRHLEQSLSEANDDAPAREAARSGAGERGDLMGAILANASLAAMDIADAGTAPGVAPLLEELEASTRRATALYGRMRLFGG